MKNSNDGAIDTRHPFTKGEALAGGITAGQLRGPGYRQLFRGYHVSSAAGLDGHQRALAAVRIHPPGAFASHLTAARILGLPVPAGGDEHVSVRRATDRRPRPGIRSHLSNGDVEITTRQGVPVSAPLDTFVALATVLGLVDLVVVGDAMVADGLCTTTQLTDATSASRQRGARLARRAAGYVRRGVDSPMETRLRMLIVLAGLFEPEVNHILRDDSGAWICRLDLSYPEYLLIVEYDGRQHAEDTRQWNRDIERRENLEAWGWKIVVITSKGVFQEPERTLARVAEALRSRGCSVPRKPSGAWRPHFARS